MKRTVKIQFLLQNECCFMGIYVEDERGCAIKATRKFSEGMADQGSNFRNWQNMHYDLLVKIFMALRVTDLTFGVSKVCSSWRAASRDSMLWETVDLNLLQFNTFDILPADPNSLDAHSNWLRVVRILNVASNLGAISVKRFIFDYAIYLKDEQLVYVASRFPLIKQLALPPCNEITVDGFNSAIQWWRGLESLTVPFISNLTSIMQIIGANCRNFSELKVMDRFDIDLATSLFICIPKLKALSLRSSIVDKKAVKLTLTLMDKLEALNIAHCLIGEIPPSPRPLGPTQQLDNSILEKASRLREFFTCQLHSCSICQFEYDDENIFRWYEYEKAIWRNDEIRSLSF